MTVALHVPRTASDEGVIAAAKKALGDALLGVKEHVGEITLTVKREEIASVLKKLRDTPGLEYQQLMEIAGVDYPDRPERFEVVYQLLSLTKNRRIRVKLSTDEATPVPSVTSLWPVAGWLEREVFDMYGVGFAGNAGPAPDSHRLRLRRLSAAQGFPAHRPCRAALFRSREARHLRAGLAAPGLPHLRLPDAVGRRRIPPAGRRESDRRGAGRAEPGAGGERAASRQGRRSRGGKKS